MRAESFSTGPKATSTETNSNHPAAYKKLSGLIPNETSDAIEDMKSLDRTLMPDGLEAAITKEQMSDLIAFLLGK